MYFYHEHYLQADCGDATSEECSDRRYDDSAYEPVRFPTIVNWLLSVSVALCAIVAAIQYLS